MGPCCTTAGRCVGCSSRGQGQLLTPGTGRCSWHLTNPASAGLQLVIQHNGGMAHSDHPGTFSLLFFFSPPMSSLGAPHRCCPPSWCLCHLTELMRWEALLLQIGCDGSWVFPKGRSVLHPAGQEGEMGLGPSAQHFHSFPCQTTGWKHRTGDWHQQLSHSCLLSLKTETCFSFYALLEKNNLKGHYSCWIGCELGFPAEILIMQAIMKLIPLWQICRAALPSADSTVDN